MDCVFYLCVHITIKAKAHLQCINAAIHPAALRPTPQMYAEAVKMMDLILDSSKSGSCKTALLVLSTKTVTSL